MKKHWELSPVEFGLVALYVFVQCLFISAKLSGYVEVPWLTVTALLWVPPLVVILIVGVLALLFGLEEAVRGCKALIRDWRA